MGQGNKLSVSGLSGILPLSPKGFITSPNLTRNQVLKNTNLFLCVCVFCLYTCLSIHAYLLHKELKESVTSLGTRIPDGHCYVYVAESIKSFHLPDPMWEVYSGN